MADDSGTTGYQIVVKSDGSLVFRAQKFTGVQQDLRVSYPAGSIGTSNYFFASLRYASDTLVGNLNLQPQVINVFGADVDSEGVLNNSHGYYIGTGGFHRVDSSVPLAHVAIPGSSLSGINSGLSLPVSIQNGFLDGIVAYVLIYDRYLADSEISDTYQFLKTTLLSRGITLV